MRDEDGGPVWRWRRTRWGPLHPAIAGRFGEPCTVVVRGRTGAILVRFADGFEVVTRFRAVGTRRW